MSLQLCIGIKTQSIARLAITMRLKITLVLAFALFLLNDREVLAQDAEGSGSGTW